MKTLILVVCSLFVMGCDPSPVEETCVDTCVAGEKVCEDGEYRACGFDSTTGCNRLMVRMDCFANDKVCGVEPGCVDACEDTCVAGEKVCENGKYMACGFDSSTGCNRLMVRMDCLANDKVCVVDPVTDSPYCLDPSN